MSLLDWLGTAAGACTTLSFVPQVLKVWRSRSARDISFGMYALFIAGLVLWLSYGVVLRAWPIIIANSVTLVLAFAILWMKLRYDRRP